ncbi:MAG TPA: ComEC/Rec2 family competence protein [Candidatus Krumholzibacteria bacterium]
MVWILTLAVAAGVARRLDLLLYVLCAAAALGRHRGSRGRAIALVVLAGACALPGWQASARYGHERATVERVATAAGGALVPLDGVVASFPQTGLHGTSFELETRVDGRRVRLEVRAASFDVNYGDLYRMRARLTRPGERARSFHASRGLAGQARVRADDMILVGRGGNPLLRDCFWPLHRVARTRLSRALGRDSGLAIGMLLGERAQLDAPVRDAVRRLGITHLLAISGMHLTTLAACVILITRSRPRWQPCALVVALSAYTFMVGDVESLTRAYLMTLVMLAMRATIRSLRPLDALAAAWFVMSVADPLSMRSVGLQLSFAATFAVLACLPDLVRAQSRDPRRAVRIARRVVDPLAAAFVMSVAVELFIAPLQLHHFGALSVVGPVATVLFFVPVTVVLLGATPVVGLALVLPAQEWPGAVLARLSTLTTSAVVACGRLAPPLQALPEPNPWLYYGGLLLGWRFRRRPVAWAAAAALLAAAFL